MRHRISSTPRKPRPVSIAVTGVTHEIKIDRKNETKPPLPKTRKSITKTTESSTTRNKVKSPVEVKHKEIVNSVQNITKSTDETEKKPPDANSADKKAVEVEVEVKPAVSAAEVPKTEK